MTTPLLRTGFILLALTVMPATHAADILANTAAFKPKITLSDSYSEKVFAEVDGGNVYRSVVPNAERIAVTVVANLEGIDAGLIDGNAVVGIAIGNFEHSGSLSDSIDYKPGLKKATFPLTKEVFLANGDSRDVRVGAVTYLWTTKLLTITITCTDIDGAGVGDLAASNYVGTAAPGTALTITDDPIDVLVTFGDAIGERTAFLRGLTHTYTRNFGSVALGTDESFDVSDVTLLGSADVTGPVVKPLFPLKPDLLNKITVTGSAADVTDVSLDAITVNGVVTKPASVALTDPDHDGVWTWTVTGLPLKKGANTVTLTFTDSDGNDTTVTKIYTIK